MKYAKPEYSRSQIDRSGKLLAERTGLNNEARTVINNWRSSHAFPLNTFQTNMRAKTKAVDRTGFVAQRIKRLPAIQHKLERFPHMRLSRMQDVGGCRAVVGSVQQVRDLRQLLKESRAKHRLADEYDYIEAPKEDGYRSHHVVYQYHSDRKETYEGLRIEIQLRTQLQHAWATAVETVGQIRQEMLKSDQGNDEWLRFFALMGTALARKEGCPPVPHTPSSDKALANEIQELAEKLEVVRILDHYRQAVRVVPELKLKTGAHYFLLNFDYDKQEITYLSFKKNQSDEASQLYQEKERESLDQAGPNLVLMSVDSASVIRRAYPNFFLDSGAFLDEVKEIVT